MNYSTLFRVILTCVSFLVLVNNLQATPQDIFRYGLQSHGSLYQIDQYQVNRVDVTGSISITDESRYISLDGKLIAENVHLEETSEHLICVSRLCNPLKGSALKLMLPEFPFRANEPSFLPESYFENSRIKEVKGRNNYFVEIMESEAGETLYLQPGDYWIENLSLSDGTNVVVDHAYMQGTVRIFIMNTPSLGSNIHWNFGGNPNALFLYSQGNLEVKNSKLNAYIYGESKVDVFDQSRVVGAINARHISISEESEVVENLAGLEALDWQGFNTDFSVDREEPISIQNTCPGYSRMDRLPAVDEDSNCVATNNPPERLSETGCFNLKQGETGSFYFDPEGEINFVPGVIPYTINSPLWSDGAKKSRAMILPEGSKITIHENGDWEFPLGSILIKNFEIYGKRVETRFLMRVDDGTVDRDGKSIGSWYGYSYEWNEEETEAILLTGKDARYGKDRWVNNMPYSDQIWRYPSQDHCFACHSGYVKYASDRTGKTYYKGMIAVSNKNVMMLFGDWFSWLLDLWWKFVLRADYPEMDDKSSGDIAKLASLGPETAQLNLSCTDPDTGVQLNQFDALKQAGAFQYASTIILEGQRIALDHLKIVNPYDSEATIEDRARSYLYVNCSSCHHGTLDGYGPGDANYDFRVSFNETKLLEPNSFFFMDWRLGVKDNLLVFPGSPESSIISIRLHFENGGSYPEYGSFVRMPYASTTKLDHNGVAVIDAWIKSGLGFSQFADVDGDGYAECQIPGVEANCLLDDPDRQKGDTPVNFHRVLGF